MRISVVIPALNEACCIRRAVFSCRDAGFDEVIVADGGSTDETRTLAAESGAHVVQGVRGRAVQQNLGAQHATGELLLFLHADNWLAAETGKQVRECMADESVLAGAFRQRIEANGRLFRWIESGSAIRARWCGMPYGDQAIFMRRKVFDELGGFPPVMLMEDLLLMRSFRKLGPVKLLPGPVHVNPRRWQREGALRQTLRNWSLITAERLGISPDRLARFYPVHADLADEPPATDAGAKYQIRSADR